MKSSKVGKLTFIVLAVLFLAGSLLMPVQTVRAGEDETCGQRLEKKCTGCHNLARVCQVLEKKSKRKWKRTIKRMAKKDDAKLSKKDQKAIYTCLTKNTEEVRKKCNE